MVAADARTAITFSLSPGNDHDAAPGKALLKTLDRPTKPLHLIMDRAYEGRDTRQLALDLGFVPVLPPKSNRVEPWEYDRAMYKRRNEVERLFRRLKGFRRIFSRFDKLDVMFLAFINFALIVDGLRYCEQALVFAAHLFAFPEACPVEDGKAKPCPLYLPHGTDMPRPARGIWRLFTIPE